MKTLIDKLTELKSEIQLTDDDVTIITFTSLNHDYFTDLLVQQGEFMKWFTLNFEGESQEEIDFLSNKDDAWDATLTYAQEVLSWWNRVGDDKSIILDNKWWGNVRYATFAENLKLAFSSDPDSQKDMRRLFTSQNDKLSYYDLFNFINKRLEISLDNWEADALETRLDRLGMAFIEFNEFNEFCQ